VCHPLVEPVADLVQVMSRMPVRGHVALQGVQATYPRQSGQKQKGEPDIVGGQRLCQYGWRYYHRMNLLYEALYLLHPAAIVAHADALSQGDMSEITGAMRTDATGAGGREDCQAAHFKRS